MMRWLSPAVLLFVTLLLAAAPVHAQIARGVVHEGRTIASEALGEDVRYTVYLPFDYDTAERHYPVVYLLHGYTDDDTGWLQFGEANRIADEAIADGTIPPMILVMPDADVSWYIDNHDGSVPYETFFIDELIPHIESTYRVRAERQYRGVAGLSMGGFGTLVYALRHPDLFAAASAFSAAIYTEEEVAGFEQDRWDRVEGVLYGPGLEGTARLTDHWHSYNPISIFETAEGDALDALQRVRLYLDCGDDDFLYKGNATFHMLLRDMGVEHEYRVRDGGHTWTYWRTGLADGLAFIGQSFRR